MKWQELHIKVKLKKQITQTLEAWMPAWRTLLLDSRFRESSAQLTNIKTFRLKNRKEKGMKMDRTVEMLGK